MHGELIPIGGGDPIPLLKKNLLVGRRESCDIVLRFSNVSAHHCQLICNGGYWYVKDLKSRNGIKVNGTRVMERASIPEMNCRSPSTGMTCVLSARFGRRRAASGRESSHRPDEAIAFGAGGA